MKKLVAIVAMVGSTFACADSSMEIGRLKVVLNEDGWERFPASAADIQLRGAAGGIAGDSALLVLRKPDGSIGAAMVVGSTRGWTGAVRTTGSCKPQGPIYVYDLSGGQDGIIECARAGGVFPTQGSLLDSMPRLRDSLKAQDMQLPATTYMARVYLINGRGSTVQVEALLAPDFAGLPNQPPHAEVPKNFSPAVAAWVDRFAEASKEALHSLRGELKVPPVALVAMHPTN